METSCYRPLAQFRWVTSNSDYNGTDGYSKIAFSFRSFQIGELFWFDIDLTKYRLLIHMFTIWFAPFPTSNREHALLIQFAIMELFWGITIISFLRGLYRWWFQIFVYFHPYLGKIPVLTNIFQLGWFNHQLVIISPCSPRVRRKTLHRGDFCSWDRTATDHRFPDSLQKNSPLGLHRDVVIHDDIHSMLYPY